VHNFDAMVVPRLGARGRWFRRRTRQALHHWRHWSAECKKNNALSGVVSASSHGIATSENQRFAGSYSLEGWEAVAGTLRWAPGAPPTFPAHTTSREGRTPRLLHVAFREGREQLRDFLFADAPGEWFQKWAIHTDATEAAEADGFPDMPTRSCSLPIAPHFPAAVWVRRAVRFKFWRGDLRVNAETGQSP
jgi:hypothetical protein